MNTQRSRAAREGFTLIELMVAVVIMTVGVLGLAGTATFVSRQIGGAGQETVAATIASTRFERMRGMKCSTLLSGTAVTRGMKEAWTVNAPIVLLGVGDAVDVKEVINYTAADGDVRRPLQFESYIPCT